MRHLSRASGRPRWVALAAAGALALLAGSPSGAAAVAPTALPPAGLPAAYEPLQRPFAMPGFKEQEFNGALFVGKGETRFSTSVTLVTRALRPIHENMVPWIRTF